ncbi:hypothetical protein FOVSG1_013660 [Fusarium oxysporum f. sp. vasinfectum]
MLRLNWTEGHGMRHYHGPFQLSLPSYNATALEIMCSVIHFRNERIPRTLAAGDVLAVAVAADKYDCLDALAFASKSWPRDSKGIPEDLMPLTTTAYLFRSLLVIWLAFTAFRNMGLVIVLGWSA